MKGLFNTMVQLNLEAGVKIKFNTYTCTRFAGHDSLWVALTFEVLEPNKIVSIRQSASSDGTCCILTSGEFSHSEKRYFQFLPEIQKVKISKKH